MRDDNKVDGAVAVFWVGYLLLIGGITYLAGWGWGLSVAGALLLIGAVLAGGIAYSALFALTAD